MRLPARRRLTAVAALTVLTVSGAAPAADAWTGVPGSVIADPGTAPAAPVTPAGTLNLLTYNVAGLPEIVNSAALPRAPKTVLIGQRLAPFDVVHVQEDFNFHADLYRADAHPFRTVSSGPAAIGGGLNTLSSLRYDVDDFQRVRWRACTFSSGDCLTPKGFTFMRLRLVEGLYLDLYNLHANAGVSAANLAARAENLAQLSEFIAGHSAGNAVVVMGDTNTRYTRAEDTIGGFVARHGLTDAWVSVERGGVPPVAGAAALVCPQVAPPDGCEVVDKVLFRGSRALALTATSYANVDAGFRDGGLPLSDHFPIAVGLSWRQRPGFRMTDQYGGPAGDQFTDLTGLSAGSRATSVSLRVAGGRVRQVSVRLGSGAVLTHGGTAGALRTLTLRPGERLTGATTCRTPVGGVPRLSSLAFRTSQGRSLAGGTRSTDCVTWNAPSGWGIAGLHGRAADSVEKVGLILTRA